MNQAIDSTTIATTDCALARARADQRLSGFAAGAPVSRVPSPEEMAAARFRPKRCRRPAAIQLAS
ncbi:MAG: hypothetical protein IPJ27_08735 [Candidatus Accumulibacter sp.]|uniref:Uncharacterized protein n=1 Tax=Candidatus Accumulibacter proximus TaxID=2954385 RepID=A0A935UGM6_9PROT|nr:hypothetical protein [Candidatus Accumulibacter proximus]